MAIDVYVAADVVLLLLIMTMVMMMIMMTMVPGGDNNNDRLVRKIAACTYNTNHTQPYGQQICMLACAA